MPKRTYPREFSGEILSRVQQFFSTQLPGVQPPVHPDVDQLAVIIDEVFFASMTVDEGRPTRCTVAFVEPEELAGVPPLAERQPLTAEALRKLSPALDPRTSCVCAYGTGSEEIEIWGITNRSLPSVLTVTAIDTGLVRVTVPRARHIFTFSPTGGPTWHSGLERLSAVQLLARMFDLRLDSRATRIVPEILRRVQTQGHGGTLVVLPESAALDEQQLSIRPEFRFEPQLMSLSDALATAEEIHNLAPPAPELKPVAAREVEGNVDFVARLAGADGAVIIDTSLAIRAFGVMLETSNRQRVPEVHRLDPSSGEKRSLPVPGGRRHQSAAAWCADRGKHAAKQEPPEGAGAEAVVLTVSEDGDASAFAPILDDPYVMLVRPLDLG
jgi:hypothetical protein